MSSITKTQVPDFSILIKEDRNLDLFYDNSLPAEEILKKQKLFKILKEKQKQVLTLIEGMKVLNKDPQHVVCAIFYSEEGKDKEVRKLAEEIAHKPLSKEGFLACFASRKNLLVYLENSDPELYAVLKEKSTPVMVVYQEGVFDFFLVQ